MKPWAIMADILRPAPLVWFQGLSQIPNPSIPVFPSADFLNVQQIFRLLLNTPTVGSLYHSCVAEFVPLSIGEMKCQENHQTKINPNHTKTREGKKIAKIKWRTPEIKTARVAARSATKKGIRGIKETKTLPAIECVSLLKPSAPLRCSRCGRLFFFSGFRRGNRRSNGIPDG
jgi:hypothetical protein